MSSGLKISYLDFSEETSTLSVRGETVTAVNHDVINGLMDDFKAAVAAVTGGVQWQEVRQMSDSRDTKTPPTDKDFHRERKWVILYESVGNKKNGTIELPIADLQYLAPKSDDMDTTIPQYAALVAAAEAYCHSTYGELINVLRIYHAGRNL